jgi:hypothetical protein
MDDSDGPAAAGVKLERRSSRLPGPAIAPPPREEAGLSESDVGHSESCIRVSRAGGTRRHGLGLAGGDAGGDWCRTAVRSWVRPCARARAGALVRRCRGAGGLQRAGVGPSAPSHAAAHPGDPPPTRGPPPFGRRSGQAMGLSRGPGAGPESESAPDQAWNRPRIRHGIGPRVSQRSEGRPHWQRGLALQQAGRSSQSSGAQGRTSPETRRWSSEASKCHKVTRKGDSEW